MVRGAPREAPRSSVVSATGATEQDGDPPGAHGAIAGWLVPNVPRCYDGRAGPGRSGLRVDLVLEEECARHRMGPEGRYRAES